MKNTLIKSGIIVTTLMFSAASMAAEQTRSEDDLIYGNRGVASTPSQPHVANGPEQQRLGSYLLWQADSQQPALAVPDSRRLVDDRRMSTDLIYGS